MFGRKKGFSAHQSNRMSRKMQSSMYGTHHAVQPSARRARRMNAQTVDFSNTKRTQRAARGTVRTVTPQTRSGESRAAYSRRVGQRQRAERARQLSWIPGVVIGIVALAIVAAIGLAVGTTVYSNSINGKVALSDSSIKSMLSEPEKNSTYYVLAYAEMSGGANGATGEADEIELVRVDPQNKVITCSYIPSTTQVKNSSGSYVPLWRLIDDQGEGSMVSTISDLTGVKIAHYFSTDSESLKKLVDSMNGISVTLSQEVDDPKAGSDYLEAGTHVLSGAQTLTLLRSTNYTNRYATQASNASEVMRAVLADLLTSQGLSFFSRLDGVSQYFKTDMSVTGMEDCSKTLTPLSDYTWYSGVVTGTASSEADGSSSYNVRSSNWASYMQTVGQGKDPSAKDESISNINKKDVKVEVRNGNSIVGAATQCGQILTTAGYTVEKTGNAEDYSAYPETMVIYKDEAHRVAAEAVAADINCSRVVDGGAYYSFDTDVLVIIGKDWQPIV